jgi:hypothetical protein
MPPLDDFLKKEKEAQQEKIKKTHEIQAQHTAEKNKFNEDYAKCYQDIIAPKVAEMIQTLQSAGHTATYGQNVHGISYTFAEGNKVISFSVTFRNTIMQVDIVPSFPSRQIQVTFTYTPTNTVRSRGINRNPLNETVSVKIEALTAVKLEEFIEKGLQKIK